jgi:nicotinamidase-related amidase
MTTLARTGTALLVIDVQNGVVGDAYDRDRIVANIATAVTKARTAGVPVVWIQHSDGDMPAGSPQWEYVSSLVRLPDEPLVPKEWGDSFEDTDLEQILADRDVGAVVVTGAASDACVRATLHGALVRGYDTRLVSDAHTTIDLTTWGGPPASQIIAFTNLYWEDSAAPGRTAGTVTTGDLSFT